MADNRRKTNCWFWRDDVGITQNNSSR